MDKNKILIIASAILLLLSLLIAALSVNGKIERKTSASVEKQAQETQEKTAAEKIQDTRETSKEAEKGEVKTDE